jgi:hypothetical protein
LNANLLRRWISESRLLSKRTTAKRSKALALAAPEFIPLQLQDSSVAPANIQIELQRGATLVRVQWPLGYAGECATWMREVLK